MSSSVRPLELADKTPLSTDRKPLLVRFQYLCLGGLLIAFLVVGWNARVPPMQAAGDDEMIYLALSKSLAQGSYREIYQPNTPLHVQYPPAYPAWLLLVRSVVGERLDLITAVNLLLVALAFVLLFRAARQVEGVGLALALILLTAMNRGVLLTASLASEGLFLLVSTAALAVTLPRADSWRLHTPAAIGLAFVAFLTRSIGLAAVIAVGAWLWSRRRYRALAGWLVTSILVVGGWFAYVHFARTDDSVRSYVSQFQAYQNSTTGAGGEGPLLGLAGRIWHGTVELASGGLPSSLSLPTIPGTLLDNVAWLGVTAVLLTGGFLVLWRKWRAAAVYLLTYLAVFLIWPWHDGRILVPIIPLGLLVFLLGAWRLTRALPRWPRSAALGLLIALPAAGGLGGASQRLERYRACNRAAPSGPECYDALRQALIGSGEYLRLHAPPSAVVVTSEPATLNYLSGLQAQHSRVLRDVPANRAVAVMLDRNIRYALIGPPWMASLLRPSCRDLQVEGSWPVALLVSVRNQEVPAAGADACESIDRLAASRAPDSPEGSGPAFRQ